MDASRYNSPSRKSRFRSQSGAAYRPAASEESVSETDAETPVYPEEEVYAEDPSNEAETVETPDAETLPESPEYAVGTVPEGLPAEEDNLPAGLRLTRSTENMTVRRKGVSNWVLSLVAASCLLVGGVGGYYMHPNAPAVNTTPNGPSAIGRTGPIIPLAPPVLEEVDAAFSANKQGKYAEARLKFDTLADKYPNWVSMRVEAARTTMYERDLDAAEKILSTISRAGANVDAEFLNGLLQMTMQAWDKSEAAFARAIALDPTRPDVFYFWGECLRRQGKPQDAAVKFREALMRNQYENAEGLYQLKLWLSEIQADQEAAKDLNAKIDEDLASGHPSGPALFAAAAREIKAKKFTEAGAHIGQARKVVEPAVFRVILQDPTFMEENRRPELAPFYQP